MSEWRDEINRKALARLEKALPDVFPPPVLTHALARRFTPPMPRLAVDFLLAGASVAGRPLVPCAGEAQRHPGGLDLAAGGRTTGSRQTARPPGRRRAPGLAGGPFSGPARALSGTRSCARPRFLLHLRPADLPVWLACGFVKSRRQPQRRVACRLCGRLGFVDGAERLCVGAQAAAAAALCANRWTPVENRGGRPPRPAVPGLARPPRRAVAEAVGLLGRTEPAGHQSRRACRQMRRGGAVAAGQLAAMRLLPCLARRVNRGPASQRECNDRTSYRGFRRGVIRATRQVVPHHPHRR